MYKLGIVDDEPKLLAGISSYYPWNELGFEIVTQLHNGKEVLEYLKCNFLDVVFTDISMPEMDGIELAKALHEEYPEIAVVFLSGYAEFKYAQQALKYNVCDYILKPVKYDEIVQVFSQIKNKLDDKYGQREEAEGYYEQIVARVNQYVEENITTATLKDAAQKVNMSPGYLSALYKKYTGQTFSDYLTQSKMAYAQKLLLDIHLKTYHVADILGYEDPKNFTRAFKSYYGKTPREFRKTGIGAGK